MTLSVISSEVNFIVRDVHFLCLLYLYTSIVSSYQYYKDVYTYHTFTIAQCKNILLILIQEKDNIKRYRHTWKLAQIPIYTKVKTLKFCELWEYIAQCLLKIFLP